MEEIGQKLTEWKKVEYKIANWNAKHKAEAIGYWVLEQHVGISYM
jgi:hypothetical protein